MTIQKDLEKLLDERPYLSRSSAAMELNISPATVSTTAHRAGIKFMTRKQVEDWIFGQEK